MLPLEHIGIAVKSLSESVPLFEKLFGTDCYKTELVESEQVNTAFFKAGETKVELLESIRPDGVISRFIDKKGEGIHHLAFAVDNIETAMTTMKEKGFILLNEVPKKGADNKLICFLHPKSTNGILIELCQDIKEKASPTL
ncbi:MAG TPA: methylmalonyl-CoA epimerase [Chitinophagaceae bacterium]|jgi:methylmalonyl-CoA/ethylmalonyl-CoA epimerase|nr:methylmalonyl-CoA epimerase [Chitinophagaceae bacterium]